MGILLALREPPGLPAGARSGLAGTASPASDEG